MACWAHWEGGPNFGEGAPGRSQVSRCPVCPWACPLLRFPAQSPSSSSTRPLLLSDHILEPRVLCQPQGLQLGQERSTEWPHQWVRTEICKVTWRTWKGSQAGEAEKPHDFQRKLSHTAGEPANHMNWTKEKVTKSNQGSLPMEKTEPNHLSSQPRWQGPSLLCDKWLRSLIKMSLNISFMYFSSFLFHAYHTTLHIGFCFPSRSALRESMILLSPTGAFHPYNLGLASYIKNNLASETSFNLMSGVYPWVTNRLPETSKCRCLHLKAHGIMESSSKEWMTNCETLWQPSHLGSLGRIYSCQEEYSLLYLKFRFLLCHPQECMSVLPSVCPHWDACPPLSPQPSLTWVDFLPPALSLDCPPQSLGSEHTLAGLILPPRSWPRL